MVYNYILGRISYTFQLGGNYVQHTHKEATNTETVRNYGDFQIAMYRDEGYIKK